MCERYTFTTPMQVIEDELGLLILTEIPPRYNIAPGQMAPVVTSEIPRQEQFMEWGHHPKPLRHSDLPKREIHATAETVESTWEAALLERRCIVLSDGFFVWKNTAHGRQPIHIRFHDHRLMSFAGLWWESDRDNLNRNFIILTTPGNVGMRQMDMRMPAILPSFEIREQWLHPEATASELKTLLMPYPDNGFLEAVEVSMRANDPRNDEPEILGPPLATAS